MTNAILRGKPDAGNPHVRFDEGEVASAKPRRGSLLYNHMRSIKLKFKTLVVGLSVAVAGTVWGANPTEKVGDLIWEYMIEKDHAVVCGVTSTVSGNRVEGEVSVPAELGERKVTIIGFSAFRNQEFITKVNLPYDVVDIGEGAFDGCKRLKEIALPPTVTKVYNYAFRGCTSLSDLKLNEGLKEIGYDALANCSSLVSLTLPSTVEKLGDGLFAGLPLVEMEIPDSVTEIGNSLFRGCTKLEKAVVGKRVPGLAFYMFRDCEVLTDVTLKDGYLDYVGEGAFDGCKRLKEIMIPSMVTMIHDYAFRGCTELTAMVFSGKAPNLGGNSVFSGVNPAFTVYITDAATGFGSTFAGFPVKNISEKPEGGDEPQPPVDPEDPPVDPVAAESNTVVFVIGEKGVHIGGGALTQFVEKASAAVAPEVEAKSGYQFTQWDASFDCVESNLTVKAEYETVRYAIAYQELKGASNANPTTYTVEDEIVFSALADVEGFQFKGWTPASVAKGTTGELVVTALWEEVAEPEPEDYVYELVTQGKMEPLALDLAALFGDEAAKMKSVAVKGLPSGLAFKDGAVSGAPKKSGVFVATVTLTTTAGKKLDAALTFVVRTAGEHVVIASCDAAMGKVKGQGVYTKGKKVTLKATANKGHVFVGWYQGDVRVSGLASYAFTMPEGDIALTAAFATVEEDRAAIAAHVDALGVDFDAGATKAAATVMAGVHLEWPVAVEALSDTTVKVSGLPSGLKFTAKDIVDRKTKLVTVRANTIYGIPTAATKPGKPSTVKIAVTTAGKTKQEFVLALTVDALPGWAMGTFNGGSELGQVSLTVAKNGKLSGKWLNGGNTWTLSAAGFDGHIEEDGETGETLYALMQAKSGKAIAEILVLVIPEGVAGYVGDEFDDFLFEAFAADWKSGELKATGAKIAKSQPLEWLVTGDQPGRVTVKFGANGAVKVAGQFQTGAKNGNPVYAKPTGSAVLCPLGEESGYQIFRLYVYLPQNGEFHGYADVLDLPWDGNAFVVGDGGGNGN